MNEFKRHIMAGGTLPAFELDDDQLNDRACDFIENLNGLPISQALLLLDHVRTLILAGHLIDTKKVSRVPMPVAQLDQEERS